MARKPLSPESPPGPSLLDRIEAGLEQLRPSEQAVGQYILRHPNQVINLTFPDIAELGLGVLDEAVAGMEIAVGRHAEVAGACAAGIRPVRALVDLLDGSEQVGKGVALAKRRAANQLLTAIDHLLEHLA